MYILFLEVVVFFVTSYFLIKYKNFFVKKLNLIDIPNERKLHKQPIPIFGGLVAIILLIECIFILYYFNNNDIKLNSFIVPFVIFFIGLYDDSIELDPNIKLLLIGIIFYVFLEINEVYSINKLDFLYNDYTLNTGIYNSAFTVLCLLLFINATNMSDGIDGLFLCISIFLFSYLLISYDFKNIFLFSFLIILIFLLYNNLKREFFMGDSGVYLISSIYGILLIDSYHNINSSIKSIEEIFIILMIPGLDMFRLFVVRILNRKNPFRPDRNHFHHLLKNRFNDKQTLIIYMGIILIGPLIFKLNIFNVYALISLIVVFFYIFTYYLKKRRKV